jgi:hypothetical protein
VEKAPTVDAAVSAVAERIRALKQAARAGISQRSVE